MAEPILLTHEHLWAALDRLAAEAGLTASGLARRAGLDPTTFNRSKRIGKTRAARWPSTESIAKVLDCLDISFTDFAALIAEAEREARDSAPLSAPSPVSRLCAETHRGRIPILRACPRGKLRRDEPHTAAWLDLRSIFEENAFAVSLADLAGTLPENRTGHLVVSLAATVSIGDPVALGLWDGPLLAGCLAHQTSDVVVLEVEPATPEREIARADIEWMGRIVLQHR